MKQYFAVGSSIIALISPLVYGKAILKGYAKPHRTTRFVLLIITALSTISLLAQNNQVAIWLAGASFVQSILIFLLSLKYGMGGWSKIDILCLSIALIGIVAWQTTKNPLLGLYFSILADFTGMIPAMVKTYFHPQTEVWTFFALDTIAAISNLFAIRLLTIEEVSYPVYIMIINLVMVGLILKPKIKKILS